MSHPEAEDIIELLDDVNGLFVRAHDPEVKSRIQQGLEMVAQHVHAAGPDAQASYIAAKKRLTNTMMPLVDPRTGERFQV